MAGFGPEIIICRGVTLRSQYVALMWQFALWGLAGAAINRALIYLEASQRVKGWPWRRPDGPGGGVFLVSQILHCCIGAVVTAAVAQSGLVSSPLLALGMGAAAPAVVKKISRYSLNALPPASGDGRGKDAIDG
jgi:hypothetical protein